MANERPSIKIRHSRHNIRFANALTAEWGAEITGRTGDWLIVTATDDKLVIPRQLFDAHLPYDQIDQADQLWRSLIVHRTGRIAEFAPDLIVIQAEDAPTDEARPPIQVGLRFYDHAVKHEAAMWAEATDYRSLNAYIEAAVEFYNSFWQRQAGEPEPEPST